VVTRLRETRSALLALAHEERRERLPAYLRRHEGLDAFYPIPQALDA
jgi:hypothetical protein